MTMRSSGSPARSRSPPTDALQELTGAANGHGVYGVVFKGARYDTGDKLDYLKAVVQIACDREDLGEDLKGWLKGYVPTLD